MAKKLLSIKCPTCGKEGHEKSRYVIEKELIIELLCGHIIIRDALVSEDVTITSSDGRTPFPFQMESAKFLEAADCNGLCLHEQGLGKTIIECLLLKRNPQLLPALIVVKSGLRAQWFYEVFRWTGLVAQVITSSKEVPEFDFFDVVIVSIDTLRLLRPDVKVVTDYDVIQASNKGKKLSKTPKKVIWTDEICARFKHIAIDESQKIKNEGASRTQALRKIVKASNDGNKARIICYSGTNIEKHAGEFFVTLNLVRDEIFHNQAHYIMRFCEVNPEDGRIGGLRDPKRFKELTQDFIIRYRREEVMPELPKIFRQFRLAEMEGDELQAYCKVVKEFQDALEDPEIKLSQSDILGYLSRMRHITGIAKVDAAAKFVEEFLLESDRKLVVFLHHQMAGAILMAKIEQVCKDGAFNPPLYLHAGLDPMIQRPALVEEFKKPGNRIMIASTQASAEGLNLQFCQDMMLMERQWNPSTEEQVEGRFPRPRPEDPWPPDTKINAHYLIAAGTIDDFLTEIVERKRRNVTQTLDGIEIAWDEKSLIGELISALRDRGLAKWKLK